MEYIDKPCQHGNIRFATERFVNRQLRGAMLNSMTDSEVQALIARQNH